jgi:cytoskeleton protein RodZ
MQGTPVDTPLNGETEGLGASLRKARESRGLSVHKAAQDMHVSDDIIEALESENFATLGAPIFVRGHLRNYARLLGLPEDQILAAERNTDTLSAPPVITLHPGGRHAYGRRIAMPLFSVIVVALLLVLGVSWWQHRPPERATLLQTDRAVMPAKMAATAPEPSSMQSIKSESSDTSKLEIAAEKHRPVPPPQAESAPASEHKQSTAISSRSLPVIKSNYPQSAAVAKSTAPSSSLTRAQFTLTQPSWVEVYDASGKRLFYKLATAGDTLNISGTGPLQVFLGNAPGVSVELNGAPFNLTPFIHPDNTARFRLGETTDNSGPTG